MSVVGKECSRRDDDERMCGELGSGKGGCRGWISECERESRGARKRGAANEGNGRLIGVDGLTGATVSEEQKLR